MLAVASECCQLVKDSGLRPHGSWYRVNRFSAEDIQRSLTFASLMGGRLKGVFEYRRNQSPWEMHKRSINISFNAGLLRLLKAPTTFNFAFETVGLLQVYFKEQLISQMSVIDLNYKRSSSNESGSIL